MRIFISLWMALLLCTYALHAQITFTHEMSDTVIVAGRAPSIFNDLNRSVDIIKAGEMQAAPVLSINEALKYAPGVDVKQRGALGGQADISVRGGSFEQTLIMVDGIKMSDPQTAHHNLDLPVELGQIERVEILKGHGSRIYGPNAFSGAVNFITKKYAYPSLGVSLSGGSYGLYDGSLYAAYPVGSLSNRISLARKHSDGYRHNTGFDYTTLSYGSSYKLPAGSINLLTGYTDKDFGANSFYSPLFLNQYEKTTTYFAALSADMFSEAYTLTPKIFWRKHDDDYKLDYTRPDWNASHHETQTYGAELQNSYIIKNFGTVSAGLELSKEEMQSSSLGGHDRVKGGAAGELKLEPLRNFSASIGLSAYYYDEWGWRYSPGVDIGYNFTEALRIYASFGQSYRLPSFTELFYNTAARIGNKQLKPEEADNYEAGINYFSGIFSGSLSAFVRRGKNIIDWGKSVNAAATDPWLAMNAAEINTEGFEVSLNARPKSGVITNIGISYSYINSLNEAELYQSLYALDNLRHQAIANVSLAPVKNVNAGLSFRYEENVNIAGRFLTDVKLSYLLSDFTLFAQATNLFDIDYKEIGGVPMPGRWIAGGVKFNISGI